MSCGFPLCLLPHTKRHSVQAQLTNYTSITVLAMCTVEGWFKHYAGCSHVYLKTNATACEPLVEWVDKRVHWEYEHESPEEPHKPSGCQAQFAGMFLDGSCAGCKQRG